nr:class I SAM-dependent methyltransferase [Desulfobulbaceae bacterium]
MTSIKLPNNESALHFDGERFVPCGDVSDELAMEHLHRYVAAIAFVRGKSVVDIASGEGYGSYILSQAAASVIGVDVDPKAVAHAQARYQNNTLRYLSGSCSSIPCPDSSVDVVVSFETLEHVSEHDEFMAEIKRVLKADGVLLLSTPNIDGYNELRDETNPFHLKELTQEEFKELLGRYFKTFHIGGQAGFFCSSLVFEDSTADRETNHTSFSVFAQDSNGQVSVLKQPPRSAYLIAVASDADIDAPVSSFYEGNIKRNIISALEGGIVERDGWCLDKDTHIHSLNDSIRALQENEKSLLQTNSSLSDKCSALEDDLQNKKVKIDEIEAQLSEYQLHNKKCICSRLVERLRRCCGCSK